MITPAFNNLQATYSGRFKLWVHYTLFHKWVGPMLSQEARRSLYLRSRRWLYGPNANNEDLIELLRRSSRDG